jgi:hypothetical protein
MSFINIKNSSAGKLVSKIGLKINQLECAEVGVAPESWAIAVIKLACIFVIGLVIIESVYDNAGLNNTSAILYSLGVNVKNQISSGYTLASLMVLVVGAVAVMSYLGFM